MSRELGIGSRLAHLKKKGNTTRPETLNSNFNIFKETDFECINYTDFEELNQYLHMKKIELGNAIVTGALMLGKIFIEVQEKLEGMDATYTEWLTDNGYNKMTALRYKNRYKLYTEASEKGKKTISIISEKLLAEVVRRKEELMPYINEGYTKEDIKNLLIDVSEAKKAPVSNKGIEIFNVYKNVFAKFSKANIEKIEEDKKKEIESLLKRLDEILD